MDNIKGQAIDKLQSAMQSLQGSYDLIVGANQLAVNLPVVQDMLDMQKKLAKMSAEVNKLRGL